MSYSITWKTRDVILFTCHNSIDFQTYAILTDKENIRFFLDENNNCLLHFESIRAIFHKVL